MPSASTQHESTDHTHDKGKDVRARVAEALERAGVQLGKVGEKLREDESFDDLERRARNAWSSAERKFKACSMNLGEGAASAAEVRANCRAKWEQRRAERRARCAQRRADRHSRRETRRAEKREARDARQAAFNERKAPGMTPEGRLRADVTQRETTSASLAQLAVALPLLPVIGSLAGVIISTIILLTKGDESEFVNDHAREAVNFQISMLIYWAIASFLAIFVIGIVFFPVLWVLTLVTAIRGSNAAKAGEYYRHPVCIRFI